MVENMAELLAAGLSLNIIHIKAQNELSKNIYNNCMKKAQKTYISAYINDIYIFTKGSKITVDKIQRKAFLCRLASLDQF